ncbi:ADP-ribosylglycohydrolase family protein [Weissella bombi]|uniref:ADP-ribosylglycohydrolase n=2 Tax=Weissella bombi TaxID=1505725 RepID=A0A1C3YX80_9LACO|nr:ADP-ribosylglycohydrolase family protein [Weissella bombi]SCB74724.1 ADP-ribosylglycohydrolase [Weissella bombi]
MVLPYNPLNNSTLGLVTGDLMGQQVEGHGTSWSGDSALTLATISSLSYGYNLTDLMDRYLDWYRSGEYNNQDERPKNVGETTFFALNKYAHTKDPFNSGGRDISDNGNGALMHITPVILYLRAKYGEDFILHDPAMLVLHQVTGLTHNHPQSLIASGIYALIVNNLLQNIPPVEAVDLAVSSSYEYYAQHKIFADHLSAFQGLNKPDLKSVAITSLQTSGYVVDTLEASIWVVLNSNTFAEALSLAKSLPGEPHRVMPLVGALAGVLYHQEVVDDIDENTFEPVLKVLKIAEQSHNFN